MQSWWWGGGQKQIHKLSRQHTSHSGSSTRQVLFTTSHRRAALSLCQILNLQVLFCPSVCASVQVLPRQAVRLMLVHLQISCLCICLFCLRVCAVQVLQTQAHQQAQYPPSQ